MDLEFESNNNILVELNKLAEIYSNENDFGRQLAYRKAYSAIKSVNFEIKSDSDL